MSNARILADLMGTSTTVPSSKLSLGTSDMPTGSVLQVKFGEFDDDLTNTTGTEEDVLTLTITPSSTSNKIYLMSHAQVSSITRYHHIKLYRKIGSGSYSQIAYGDNSSEASREGAWYACSTGEVTGATYMQTNSAGFFLDEPATTSQLTYKISAGARTSSISGYAFTVNSAHYHGITAAQNTWWNTFPITTLTAMEIAG